VRECSYKSVITLYLGTYAFITAMLTNKLARRKQG